MEESTEVVNVEMKAVPLCLNCGAEVPESYCAKCGQSIKVNQINLHYFFEKIIRLLEIDKGVIHTLTEMIKRPKSMIEGYLRGKRVNITSSVKLMFITFVLMELVSYIINGSADPAKNSFIVDATNFQYDENLVIRMFYFSLILTSSISTRIVYHFKKYNFLEHVVMNFFVMATSKVFSILFEICTWNSLDILNLVIYLFLLNSFYYRIMEEGKLTKKVFWRLGAVSLLNCFFFLIIALIVIAVWYFYLTVYLGLKLV